MKQIFIIIIFVLLTNLHAEEKNRSTTVMFPFVLYTGETSFTGGAFAIKTIRPENQEMSIPPTTYLINGMFSVKKNALIFTQTEQIFLDGKLIITPFIKYQNWPTEFYGIGNETREEDMSKYTQENFEVRFDSRYRLIKDISLKGGIRYQKTNLLNKEIPEMFLDEIPGTDGFTLYGSNIGIELDTRDNSIYPSKGWYLSYLYSNYYDIFNAEHAYVSDKAEIRYFHSINDQSVLALQGVLKNSSAKAPFSEMSLLGEELRAYKPQRFIDHDLYALKAEYRIFPWESTWKKRLGFVAFSEVGQIAKDMKDFNTDDIKYSLGGGIRFSIIPSEKLNLRLDLAKGDDSFQVTFIAREFF